MEINKVVYAYNKGYRVDEFGNVIGLRGEKLKLIKNTSKYLSFSFRHCNNKVYYVRVHRLQAYQKYKDNIFKKGVVVRHLNGISTDNSISNIYIGNQSQNMMDIPEEIRVKKSSNPKYNHNDIIKDRESGYSYREIMTKYNINSKGTVSFICNKSLENKKLKRA